MFSGSSSIILSPAQWLSRRTTFNDVKLLKIIFNYSPKGRWIVVNIYLALYSDPEGNSCFSIYQISWAKLKKLTFCESKTPLSRNFVCNLQTFRGFCQVHFSLLLQIQNNILPCTRTSFIARILSSENVSKRDTILAPVAKQWIAKDIPSYRSRSKRAKIAIHWFSKY